MSGHSLHLRIRGKVQGVGYRHWTLRTATKLGLSGWVRNLTDGSVEAVARGPKAALDQLVASCHAGPPLARVTEVQTNPSDENIADGFQQRPTAEPS